MQGVRTAPRGCLGCRRRKKACNGARPVCERCERLKVACRYEERQLIFVNESEGFSGSSQRPGIQRARTATPPVLPHLSTGAAQQALVNTDIELQADAGFFSLYLPQDDLFFVGRGNIAGAPSTSWIPAVRTLAREDANLRTAVRALSFAGLGWMRSETPLVQHGLRLYALALRQINALLRDPISAQSDAVLACCRVFSVFEMFRRAPTATAAGAGQVMDWQKHIDGMCRLVQLRGPQGDAGHRLSLFDATRATAIFHGIGRRQPNAFTAQSWTLPREKTLRDQLYDAMSMAPILFDRNDRFNSQVNSQPQGDQLDTTTQEGRDLFHFGISICERLWAWEERAIDQCKRQRTPSNGSSSSKNTTPEPAALVDLSTLHGDDFFFLCGQYWAVSLQVYHEVRVIRQRLTTLLDDASAVPQLSEQINPEPCAQNLARVSPHFFRPGAGLWSAQSAVYPLGAALFYFVKSGRRDSPVFDGMMKTFSESATGVVMRDFLRNIVLDCKRF